MAKQTLKDFAQSIRGQLIRCSGFEGDEIATARKKALDYYFQRPRGDEVAGRSQVVSGDLSAMVEANLATMLPAFTGDRVAEFNANGAEDENQAQLESDAVQYYVMEKSNGVLTLVTAIKDALLLRNGIAKPYVSEKTTKTTIILHNVKPLARAALDGVIYYNEESGECHVQEKRSVRDFLTEPVPLENFLYTADWHKLSLQDIPFCAERHISTKSELTEMFPKKKKVIAELPRYSVDTNSMASQARNPRNTSTYRSGIDESQDQVEWYECYVLADRDGDGLSERLKVCIAQNEILEEKPVMRVPYGAGTAIIAPHRFLGISLFDKLKQTQDINTGLNRALMDDINTTTKNRLAYMDGAVNVDDVSDGRPNGAIRVNRNVGDIRNAVMPFTVPGQSASILSNIQHQTQVRSELGGAALDMQSANLQMNDRMGSQGVDRMYSVQEQLAAMFTKMIAETLIREIYLLAHATMREYFTEPIQIKVNGRWTETTPSKWKPRESVTVKPGMSAGERTRRANTLWQMLQTQIAMSEKGMDDVLINLDGFYATLMDWARTLDIKNPERYFIDPMSDSSKSAMKMKQAQAAQDKKLQQQLVQQAVGLEQLKVSMEKYKQDSELQWKYYDTVLGAEVEEAKIAGKAAIDLLAARDTADAVAETSDDSE